jgi:hypothetical protein
MYIPYEVGNLLDITLGEKQGLQAAIAVAKAKSADHLNLSIKLMTKVIQKTNNPDDILEVIAFVNRFIIGNSFYMDLKLTLGNELIKKVGFNNAIDEDYRLDILLMMQKAMEAGEQEDAALVMAELAMGDSSSLIRGAATKMIDHLNRKKEKS